MTGHTTRPFWPLALAGLTLEAVLLYWVWLGDLAAAVPLFWLGLLPVGLAYWYAGRWTAAGPGGLGWILGLALVFRCTMLFSPPTLSDDIYRYVWDGRQQLAGINPYRHPPADEAVAGLRDALYPGINNKDIPTIYPPAAQLFFLTAAWIKPSLLTIKAGLVLVDAALILLLAAMLRRGGRDPRRVLYYAWHPLPLVEIAGSGHIDVLGVFFVFAALYALQIKRRAAAALALAGGFLAKLLPLMLLPLFWREFGPHGRWRDWLAWHPRKALLLFPAATALGLAPYIAAGPQLLEGLQTYVLRWRFNDALFSLVYGLLKDPRLTWDDTALQTAKLLCALAVIGVALWALRTRAEPTDWAAAVFGAYLLLTPTLHPWYLLWILPFAVFAPRPAWPVLGFSAFLAYEVLIGYSTHGVWQEKNWVLWAEFVPFYTVLALGAFCRRLNRAPNPEHVDRGGVSFSP